MALYHECSVSRQHRQIPMAGLGEVQRDYSILSLVVMLRDGYKTSHLCSILAGRISF